MCCAHEFILRLSDEYSIDIALVGLIFLVDKNKGLVLHKLWYGNSKLIILDEQNANLDDAGRAGT